MGSTSNSMGVSGSPARREIGVHGVGHQRFVYGRVGGQQTLGQDLAAENPGLGCRASAAEPMAPHLFRSDQIDDFLKA